MQNRNEYVEKNKQRFLEELFELLRFPSVSADPKYQGEVQKTAAFVAQKLKDAGVESVEICPTAGHPIVYGEKIVDPKLPTILVYGHYDVQPPDPLELWHTPLLSPLFATEKFSRAGLVTTKASFICM